MAVRRRVECFVDGFNLYHAVDNLKRPHLKWLDLRKLTSFFMDPHVHELKSIFYFSAIATWLPQQSARHRQYVEALKSCGTTPVMGQFKAKDKRCNSCGARWVAHEEKETDVNIALWLINRAYKNEYDEAFIVSRDSDLTPAVKMVLEEFPNKQIKIISPPKAGHSKEMGKLVGDKKLASIKDIHLERSLFPAQVVDPDTKLIIAHRPSQYNPPT
ncbi:NYN domain-containing protein [Methylobacterium sp. E-046]|uniref:NYN domain-containing protein n=1 Tax=Methylobacterium sp. E-046 TaxID=2836576 RepID=UPI001FBBCBAB|nr:NYN domain-containing protein [Methylobacterium sp. E-046]MCJ2099187.1 NYN domain-containing protein [Methylobacterium sp. E-046]